MLRKHKPVGALVLVGLLCLSAWLVGVDSNSPSNQAVTTTQHQTNASHSVRRTPRTINATNFELEGNVRSVGGKPLPGARVCVLPGLDVCSTADARGSFSLPLPIGSVLVLATAAEHLPRAVGVKREPHTAPYASIVLEPGGVPVGGTVLDSFGGSVPGATVTITSIDGAEVLGAALSDLDGRFQASVPEGRANVFIRATGYSRRSVRIVAPVSALSVALAPASAIKGTVRVEGSLSPLAQITVRAQGSGPVDGLVFDTVTDAKGAFILDALAPGRYDVSVEAALWTSDSYSVGLAVGATEDVAMLAAPAQIVRGRVLVAESVCRSGLVQLIGDTYHVARVENDGVVSIGGVPSGSYRVAVRCQGAHPATSTLQVADEPLGALDWRLEPALSVGGFVASRVGIRQSNVNIRIEAVDHSMTTDCRTDQSGNFQCTGLQEGWHRCFVELDGSPVSDVVEVDVNDRSKELVRLQMLDAGTVRIRTHDGSLSRSAVALRRRDRHMVYASAGDDGAYEFYPLLLGEYEVISLVGGGEQKLATVVLSYAGQLQELTVEIPAGGTIAGRVVDDQSIPVPDAWVTARNSSEMFAAQTGRVVALTDAQGQFTLADLVPGGEYQVHAETAWATGETTSVRTGDRIEVALRNTHNAE